jgi:hypothetical protein
MTATPPNPSDTPAPSTPGYTTADRASILHRFHEQPLSLDSMSRVISGLEAINSSTLSPTSTLGSSASSTPLGAPSGDTPAAGPTSQSASDLTLFGQPSALDFNSLRQSIETLEQLHRDGASHESGPQKTLQNTMTLHLASHAQNSPAPSTTANPAATASIAPGVTSSSRSIKHDYATLENCDSDPDSFAPFGHWDCTGVDINPDSQPGVIVICDCGCHS